MNTTVLKQAEKKFLTKYPGGFKHPEMVAMKKKHKMEQMEAFARDAFSKASFEDPDEVVASAAKLVGRSTMISMFEKPKFRDMTKKLKKSDKEALAEAYFEVLHGKEKAGFERLVDELLKRKLAKWPLCTVIQAYCRFGFIMRYLLKYLESLKFDRHGKFDTGALRAFAGS